MKNSEEKNVRREELNDEELEEISGGGAKNLRICRCPRCNEIIHTIPGTACPHCLIKGVKSYVVRT